MRRQLELTKSPYLMDSPNAVIFDQAENRLRIQEATLVRLLDGGVGRFFHPNDPKTGSLGAPDFPARSAHA